jgi:hypothetical protein
LLLLLTAAFLQARVSALGGKVVVKGGSHRVMGLLAMTRAIGDHFLRPYVIPEPEVGVSRWLCLLLCYLGSVILFLMVGIVGSQSLLVVWSAAPDFVAAGDDSRNRGPLPAAIRDP